MPGCVTEGKNLEDAFENATDAASGWVLDELEEGNVVPKSSDYDSVERREGGQVSMVLLDMDAYAERYGEKAVRKNVTIPAWLNSYAEKQKIKPTAFNLSSRWGVPFAAQWLTNLTSNHEVVGSIPGLAQWVKDLALL